MRVGQGFLREAFSVLEHPFFDRALFKVFGKGRDVTEELFDEGLAEGAGGGVGGKEWSEELFTKEGARAGEIKESAGMTDEVFASFWKKQDFKELLPLFEVLGRVGASEESFEEERFGHMEDFFPVL